MGYAGRAVGALRVLALWDAAQEMAVVCLGNVSGRLDNRRDESSGADLLRPIAQRVCGECAEGRCPVTVSEFSQGSRQIRRQSADLPEAD